MTTRLLPGLLLPLVLLLIPTGTGVRAADNANDGNTHQTVGGPDGPAGGGGGEGGGDRCDRSGSGSPVLLDSGEFVWSEVDVVLIGRPRIALSRHYRAFDAREGHFGKGFSSDCERALIRVVDYADEAGVNELVVKYVHRLANGRRYAFTAAADGDFVAPEGLPRRRLERLDATRLAIVHLDGRREIYGERGQLVAEEDRNGNRVDYTREGGELVRVADTNGRFLELARDSTGHVTEVRDHVGRSWRYAYNEDGTLASVTDPLGGTRRYAYETVRRAASAQPYPVITRISDETERTVVAVTYAEDGRVESYTRGENVFTYGTRRGYIEKSDARGSRWSYLLDERGNKTEIWPPINGGEPERRLYTDDGELARLTDVAGTEYAIERDARDRVTALISPDGTIAVRYEGANAWPAAVISTSGRETRFDYDASGNLLRRTDPSGAVTRHAWSEAGDLVETVDAEGNVFTRRHDAAGRLLERRDAAGAVTSLVRDARGNVITIGNPLGEVTTLEYDLLDRLVRHTDAAGLVTAFVYDGAGRTLEVSDPAGRVTRFDYDDAGRLVTETRSDGATYTYAWSSDDLLERVSDPRGSETVYRYDAGKRLISQRADAVSNSFTYDLLGRLVGARSTGESLAFTYDALGRVLSETQGGETFYYDYNVEGELVAFDALGERLLVEHDVRGLPSVVTTPTGQHAMTRDALGRVTERTLPGGALERLDYDGDGRPVSLDQSAGAGVVLGYTYDALGQLVQASGLDPLGTAYGYDASHRLIERLGSERFDYPRDALGNRLDAAQVYGELNELLEDARYTYAHDALGNRSGRIRRGDGREERYTHDGLGRLVHVERRASATARFETLAAYSYDALGRRVRRISDGTTTTLYWQGPRLLAESVGGTLTRRYRYLGGFAPLEYADADGDYLVHLDRQGDAHSLSDTAGRLVWRRQLDPYGQATLETDVDGDGTDIDYNQTFAGQYRDGATGLDLNLSRDYDSESGRYLQPDPLGITGGLNAYLYAAGNPAMLNDPYGRFVCGGVCIGSIIVGGVTLYVHWNRNTFNEHPTLFDAQEQRWTQLPDNQSVYHQMGVGHADNIKFVSPDGHSEAVFDGNGQPVTDPSVYATYNYAGPDSAFLHTVFDIVPYLLFGNTPGDMFNPDRFGTTADSIGDWLGLSPDGGDGDGGGGTGGPGGGGQGGMGGGTGGLGAGGGGGLGGFGGVDPHACR